MITNTARALTGGLLVVALGLAANPSESAQRPVRPPPEGYEHTRFAPAPDILKLFHGFAVSFDSKDDDGKLEASVLRVPHWVAHEVRRWEPPEAERDDDAAWCLDTVSRPSRWFADRDLFASGVSPNDDSYRSSGFNRGHMAMKLLVERLGQDAAYNTHTVLNAVPQRPRFNQGIWQNLEYLTGAWAQVYRRVWIVQGPVFHPGKVQAWIGEEGEPEVAVPDAVFKIVIREKTEQERDAAADRDKTAPEVLAFLYPQLASGYFGSTKDYRHERFLATIDEIEELTGLDFKPSADPSIERRVERRRAEALWHPVVVDHGNRRLFLSGCRS